MVFQRDRAYHRFPGNVSPPNLGASITRGPKTRHTCCLGNTSRGCRGYCRVVCWFTKISKFRRALQVHPMPRNCVALAVLIVDESHHKVAKYPSGSDSQSHQDTLPCRVSHIASLAAEGFCGINFQSSSGGGQRRREPKFAWRAGLIVSARGAGQDAAILPATAAETHCEELRIPKACVVLISRARALSGCNPTPRKDDIMPRLEFAKESRHVL
jgi:hypothetical protein